MSKFLIAGVAIATSLVLFADHAEAFGGRGYARRQARHAYYAPAPVVVQRVPAAVVVQPVFAAPVVSYRALPVPYQPPVSVSVGRYGSYYGPGYFGPSRYGYPSYGGGVSVRVGW